MRQRLRDCVWWPGINQDVELHVRHCQACLLSNKSALPVTAPLHSIPFPPKPWHTVVLNIKGELHAVASRWRYLIVAYDLHSKCLEVRAVNTVTSSAVISFLEELFSRWGLPKRSSPTTPSNSCRAKLKFFTSLGIEHAQTALYHPQANGVVERFNRFLTDQLRLARFENKPVDEALFIALSIYRSTRHCTTQRSPAELMCGRGMAMPLDRLRKLAPLKAVSFQLDNDVRRSQRRNERNYNARKHALPCNVSEGQNVHIRDNIRSNKYEPMWTKPRLVTEQIGYSTVLLDNGKCRRHCPCQSTNASTAVLPSTEAAKPLLPQPVPTPAVEQPVLRRSERERRPPAWHADYAIPKANNKH